MPVIVILKISLNLRRFSQPLENEGEGGLLQLLLISHACDVYTAVLGTRKHSRNNTLLLAHTRTHTITAPLIDVTHEFARENERKWENESVVALHASLYLALT